LLVSVKHAVCCCVYLNSQEWARDQIGSNWSNWLKADPVYNLGHNTIFMQARSQYHVYTTRSLYNGHTIIFIQSGHNAIFMQLGHNIIFIQSGHLSY